MVNTVAPWMIALKGECVNDDFGAVFFIRMRTIYWTGVRDCSIMFAYIRVEEI
jgi:hypothetical protein